ncbi:MAG: alpha/beta fold hydrolase, partial [Longimicrobiales bacterium]
MWHRVAPTLAEECTVVCADLRGYGTSGKPPSRPDHAPYAKSVMALDMVRMMAARGFPRFAVAGHDRRIVCPALALWSAGSGLDT